MRAFFKPFSLLALMVAAIYAANWSISHIGQPTPSGAYVLPVGFGLTAPSGYPFAGLLFTLRDLLDRCGGRRWVLAAIIIGAALSAYLSGPLALASGVAFLLSELADFAVYTPLRQRSWLGAIAASNTVGALVDSALFLSIAFGPVAVEAYLLAQVLGKTWATVVVLVPLWAWRWWSRKRGGARVGWCG